MKRLVVFFDGTWNRPDIRDETTNVVKLHRAVPAADPAGVRQLSHYEIGIATDKDLGRWTFAAGAIGVGVTERIQSGYRFLVENYEPGDEISIFGFSRGAFQARSLGGLVALLGVLRSEHAGRIEEAWEAYQESTPAVASPRRLELRKAAHYPAGIRLIGVWDTVGNLSLPLLRHGRMRRALRLHGTELSPAVDVGLHALAIDEPRGPFRPTFWTKRKGAALPSGQHIEQVWFSGCHANVGGGYKDSGLSDISLLWMAERAMATTGLHVDMPALRSQTAPNPLAEAVVPTSGGVYRISGLVPFIRLIRQNPKAIPPWRRAILGTWRASRLPPGIECVNEAIHDSALARFGQNVRSRRGDTIGREVYRPRSLRLALRRRWLARLGLHKTGSA